MIRTVFSSLGRSGAAAIVAIVAGCTFFSSSTRGQESRQLGTNVGLPAASAQADALLLAAAKGLDYVPGEVLFKFKKGTLQALQQRALMAIRSRPRLADVRWSGDVGMIHDDTQPDARVLAQQLAEQGEVEFAQPNYIRHLAPEARSIAPIGSLGTTSAAPAPTSLLTPLTPNDPLYGQFQWNFPLIGMPGGWGINPGGSSTGIVVAVIDTGLTTVTQFSTTPLWNGSAFVSTTIPFARSPDITSSRVVRPADLVFLSSGAVLDLEGHGTHVASTIGEDTNNNFGFAGIAFNVRIMPIKVCTGYWEAMIARGQSGTPGFAQRPTPTQSDVSCPDSAVVEAIHDAADAGAKVINISLGGQQPSPSDQSAIQYAVGKGAFVAIAMGNDFANGNPTEYPAFYAASIDGAMSVASVSSTMAHASYSSSGPYCEIAAPGGDGPSSAITSFVWQAGLDFTAFDTSLLAPSFDQYTAIGMAGTSMATPHVAGLAALIMSQYPGISPAAVEALIKRTAMDLGDKGRDDLFGSGLIQARAALFGLGVAK